MAYLPVPLEPIEARFLLMLLTANDTPQRYESITTGKSVTREDLIELLTPVATADEGD